MVLDWCWCFICSNRDMHIFASLFVWSKFGLKYFNLDSFNYFGMVVITCYSCLTCLLCCLIKVEISQFTFLKTSDIVLHFLLVIEKYIVVLVSIVRILIYETVNTLLMLSWYFLYIIEIVYHETQLSSLDLG